MVPGHLSQAVAVAVADKITGKLKAAAAAALVAALAGWPDKFAAGISSGLLGRVAVLGRLAAMGRALVTRLPPRLVAARAVVAAAMN
jgi:ABC-type uncharacterized transport system YnjBCD ATPase subunit